MFDKNTVIEKKKTGRPSKATEERKAEFLQLLLEGTRIRKACEICQIDKATVFRWLKADSEFRDQYARARDIYVEFFIEEIVDGVENVPLDRESIQKQKLITDTKLTILEKIFPRKYGRYVQHDHTVELMSERIMRIRAEEEARISGREQAISEQNQLENSP